MRDTAGASLRLHPHPEPTIPDMPDTEDSPLRPKPCRKPRLERTIPGMYISKPAVPDLHNFQRRPLDTP